MDTFVKWFGSRQRLQRVAEKVKKEEEEEKIKEKEETGVWNGREKKKAKKQKQKNKTKNNHSKFALFPGSNIIVQEYSASRALRLKSFLKFSTGS